jgi:tetraacyldisaccharide 4'-kinase
VVKARLEPSTEAQARLKGQAVIAVAGIGRPEKFSATLREAGAQCPGGADLRRSSRLWRERCRGDDRRRQARNCLIATTEKDFTKLGPLWPPAERDRLVVVPVTLVFESRHRSPRSSRQPQARPARRSLSWTASGEA